MTRKNLYADITARIVAQLKAGTVPWRQPWSSKGGAVMPRNFASKRPYSGVNVLLLWGEAHEKGYDDAQWLTYNQAQEAGGQVRKGEKGTHITFVTFLEKEKEGRIERIPFLKGYTVFNVAQVEGLKLNRGEVLNPDERKELAEAFIKATGAEIEHNGVKAFFQNDTLTGRNFIRLPEFGKFESAEAYYETAFHELTHWTGHKDRLNRTFGKVFGDATYSAEELVAELGAAFLMGEFKFDGQGRDAAYIQHWIRFLEDHEHAIVTAASMASKAALYLHAGEAEAQDQKEAA